MVRVRVWDVACSSLAGLSKILGHLEGYSCSLLFAYLSLRCRSVSDGRRFGMAGWDCVCVCVGEWKSRISISISGSRCGGWGGLWMGKTGLLGWRYRELHLFLGICFMAGRIYSNDTRLI